MTHTADNGGSAFPAKALSKGDHGFPITTDGMSLRDYFAGRALMSLPHLCAHDTLMDGITFEQHVAKNAYALADAMLAARKGGAA